MQMILPIMCHRRLQDILDFSMNFCWTKLKVCQCFYFFLSKVPSLLGDILYFYKVSIGSFAVTLPLKKNIIEFL